MKKQFYLVLALMMTGIVSWGQTLNIGGHRAPLDTLNHIWLCSIPQFMFGENYTAQVNYGEEVGQLIIEGIEVANDDPITFEGVEGGKQYAVTMQLGDSLYTGAITFTWLPIVEMFGDFNKEYSYGTVYVSEPDSALAEPLMAKVKWRGGATNVDGKHKRNYRIKFVNEEDSTKENHRFFGLRNDNSWILDAGQMDFLRVRNRVSTDLWLDMARRPWYSDTLPNAHNGSRGKMVEVMLNGEYRGIYNMCEPIDRKQLKLKRYDEENQEFHGQLWTAYQWSRTVSMSNPEKRTNRLTWRGFEVTYPDYDEIHRVNWKPLETAVWFAKSCDEDRQKFNDSIGYYFDIPVMQDYFIFIVTLQALDNESKNIYYGVHDITEHPRLTMAPWDLDICLGQPYSPKVKPGTADSPEREVNWIYHMPMAIMWATKDFHNDIVARYKELRKTVLETENLVARYRNAINSLERSGAATREEERWSGDTDLSKRDLDLSAEMDYVEDWLRRRMVYLDENVFIEMGDDPEPPEPIYPRGDVNGDLEVGIADVNAAIDIILGGHADEATLKRADVNDDNEIGIADVNAIIDIILK